MALYLIFYRKADILNSISVYFHVLLRLRYLKASLLKLDEGTIPLLKWSYLTMCFLSCCSPGGRTGRGPQQDQAGKCLALPAVVLLRPQVSFLTPSFQTRRKKDSLFLSFTIIMHVQLAIVVVIVTEYYRGVCFISVYLLIHRWIEGYIEG